jgi:hypothetical protein
MYRGFVKLQQIDGSFAMKSSRKVKENCYPRFGEEELGATTSNITPYKTKIPMKIKGHHQPHPRPVILILSMKTSDSRRRMRC